VIASAHSGRPAEDSRAVLVSLAANPLLLATLAGLGLLLSGTALPELVFELLLLLGAAGLPLALLAVGAQLEFRLPHVSRGVFLAPAVKLLFLPVVTALACRLYSLGATESLAAVAFAASPCWPRRPILDSAVVDEPLCPAQVTAQTALAAIAMPLMIAWLV